MEMEGGRENEFETYDVLLFFSQAQGADCTNARLFLWQQGQYQQLALPYTALCSYFNMAHLHIGLWTQTVG